MARSSSTQSNPHAGSGATCEHCGACMKRNTDLPRHMLIHAKDKEEFMFACPIPGCTHKTLQKSNLATHIRTHTRTKPHKCPEYFPNGQKCDFATADPSSLHRHRKRKHGYQPKSSMTTSSAQTASGSGARQDSVESSTSFESEETFGLRPETSNADPDTTAPTLAYSIHRPYLASDKLSAHHYDFPYHPPLDLKVPAWIGPPVPLPSTFHAACGFACEQAPTSCAAELASSVLTKETSLEGWPATYCRWSYEPSDPSAFSSTSPLVNSRLHFPEQLATSSLGASSSEFAYLPLPPEFFPSRSTTTLEWQ
ncbi:hypothetical protein C8R44DRAFT_399692 [Mycena epipterygia]|nr:hypothetical protein C8R44DRAFT_399692 [Mycena epipterygia]